VPHLTRFSSPWLRYEIIKQAWVRKNPNSTPFQYQEFIRKLTRELGI